MQGSVRKKGSKWYYSIEVGKENGKRKRIERAGGSTKKEALDSLRKALNEFERCGSLTDESNISVADYFDYWYKEYVLLNCKFNTQQAYKTVIHNHIVPVLGMYKLKTLTSSTLQEFLNTKHRNGYTRNSIANFFGVLSGALKMAAYPYNFIKENPMQYVSMPKIQAKKKDKDDLKIISLQDFKKIIERFPETSNFYIPLQIAFNTGMRAAEVCGLTWDCVDLDNKQIRVEKIILKKQAWEFGTTKTISSERSISIGDTLVKILKKHRNTQLENRLKYGKFYDNTKYVFEEQNKMCNATDMVCTKENGELISTESLKYLSRVINYELGISFNFHSLRHTHATMLLEAGANIKDIQERLGHSKLSTTMDTYSHVTKKMKEDSVNIFENSVLAKLPTL